MTTRGKREKLKSLEQDPVTEDIAVLRMNQQLGRTTLKFADTAPRRGDFVYTINFQAEDEPGSPAKYLGVVALTPKKRTLTVLTGIEPWIPAEDADESKALPGASGGVMVNANGDIIGMIYAGKATEKYKQDDSDFLTTHELRDEFGVSFPGIKPAPDSGFQPSEALLVDNDVLRKALDSPKIS